MTLLLIQFLHPEFLYGLFLLVVPIILHLFSLKRYKKVYFSNFKFLAALQQQKKNSSKIKNLFLLLLRLLVISCLVIAFATPYLKPEHKIASASPQTPIIIYVDNSFSMTNSGSQGTLLEEAKKHLFDIVNTYPNGSSFRLLTNDPTPDFVFTKEQTISALSQIKISPSSKSLSQIYKEAQELSAQQTTTLFILSDFQKKDCDFQHIQQDSSQTNVLLILKPENKNNLFISEVKFPQAFHQKNQNDKIQITVRNASAKEYHNIPVSLTINDKKKSVNQIDVPAQGEKKIEINYLNTEEGFYQGIVEITDFPVVFDNKYYFSYPINNHAQILHIWQDQLNPYFGKLFSDSTLFGYTSCPINQTSTLNLSPYSLILLDGISQNTSGWESMLEEYLMNGGNLFILPGTARSQTAGQNNFLQKLQAPYWGTQDTTTSITKIETQASLFRDVFEKEDKRAVLPQIKTFYPLSCPTSVEQLLTDKRNNTLLASKPFGKGTIYVSAFSFDPENSDMVYHPLFIPLMANMACPINSALNTAYFLNTDKPILIHAKQYNEHSSIQIRQKDQNFEFIPEIRKDFSGDLLLTNGGNIQEAGHYEVIQNEQVIDVLAWNYDRAESQMEFCSEEELQKQFPHARIENIQTSRLDHNSSIVKEIVLQDNNKYLTFWFLCLAILALLLEQIVWKRKLN